MTRKQHIRPPMPLKAIAVTRKGTFDRRIIGKASDEKREYFLHATKGYRSFRRRP